MKTSRMSSASFEDGDGLIGVRGLQHTETCFFEAIGQIHPNKELILHHEHGGMFALLRGIHEPSSSRPGR